MFHLLMVIFVLASELRSVEFSKKIRQRQKALLREAMDQKNVEATRALIRKGVDLITPFEDSYSPLHIASLKSEDMLKLFLAKKVPLEAKNKKGETAFLLTVIYGHTDNAAMLLEAGADVNAADKYGFTSLHWKVVDSCIEMIEWLIHKGASLYLTDNIGGTPFDYALYWQCTETVRIMIEYGADISPPEYHPVKIFEKYWEPCFKMSHRNFNNFDDYVANITNVFLMEHSQGEYSRDDQLYIYVKNQLFPLYRMLKEMSCGAGFEISDNYYRNYDDYVAFIRNAFLTELPDDKNFQDDTLSIYAKNKVFALYRILKATYPKEKMRRIPSRLESAKYVLFDIFATRITKKTYFGTVPLEIISDVWFLSERIFWKIERLSFYLALKSLNFNHWGVNESFFNDEVMQFIKYPNDSPRL